MGIALAVGATARGVTDMSDESTVLATFDGGGIAPGWLWAWLFLAPAIGTSPPVVAVTRMLGRLRRKRTLPR